MHMNDSRRNHMQNLYYYFISFFIAKLFDFNRKKQLS